MPTENTVYALALAYLQGDHEDLSMWSDVDHAHAARDAHSFCAWLAHRNPLTYMEFTRWLVPLNNRAAALAYANAVSEMEVGTGGAPANIHALRGACGVYARYVFWLATYWATHGNPT